MPQPEAPAQRKYRSQTYHMPTSDEMARVTSVGQLNASHPTVVKTPSLVLSRR